MAGDALSFADVLRDEYLCLQGHQPPCRPATIEPRHLRELAHLEHKVMTSGEARYSVLKEAWFRTDAGLPTADRAAAAFTLLLHQPELFRKLLADKGVRDAVREPQVLGRLLKVPHARRVVFIDRRTGQRVVDEPGLLDVFLADSPAVRLLADAEGGKEMFERYPELLATIADDRILSACLRGRVNGEKRRNELIRLFNPDPPRTESQVWSPVLSDDALVKTSRNAIKVAGVVGMGCRADRAPRSVDDNMTALNALLLETAFSDCFTDSYDVRAMNRAFHEKDMAALCLSGGGIRSATFNLGILQGLADHRLLTKFHYVSTVSGGGYIGSWLSSWVRRHTEGLPGVAEDLSAAPADPEEPEVEPIRHLRAYSSYLAPNATAFSADTWTIVATYVRNLLLNWTMLVPAMLAVLAVPRVVEAWVVAHVRGETVATWAFWVAALAGIGAAAMVSLIRPLDKRSGNEYADHQIRARRYTGIWLLPLISSLAFCILWASHPALQLPAYAFGVGAAVASAIHVGRRIWDAGTVTRRIAGRGAWEIAASGASGAAAGWLLMTLFAWLFPVASLGAPGTLRFERFVCFAPALFLFIVFLASTLLVGLTTIITTDDAREWRARIGAFTFVAAVGYMAAASAVLLLPLLIGQASAIVASLGGVSAVASWLLARAEMLVPRGEEKTGRSRALGIVLKGAAAVTLVLVIGSLALLTSWGLGTGTAPAGTLPQQLFGKNLTTATAMHLTALRAASANQVGMLIGIAAAVAVVMSFFLNVNVYSMHGMYRNRLIRAYLGASRWFRRPDAFTGFDPHDDLPMYELRTHAVWPSDFVYVHGFATKLVGMPWFQHMRSHVQPRIRAFVEDQGSAPEDEMASDLARALNKVMVERDLSGNVPAPRSYELFVRNRRYLDAAFRTLLRRMGTREEPHERPGSDPGARPKQDEVVFANPEHRLDVPTPRRRMPPLHVVNTTLNLVGGDNLAWQERKADSFTISPLHSGNRRLGYRDSYDYGKRISLGTAMAISGAAVSPNMGYNSSAVVTFLMTFFNARLGWWLGNPARERYDDPGPKYTLNAIVAEALGKTNDTSDYVFLSDGGHFDNLGIYEMVRRRCRYIVACDATADSKYAFADLGNAVRKIRVDTGIPISLSTTYLPPSADQKFGRYCALGLIHYGSVDCDLQTQPNDPHRFGYLLYVKPAAYAECPPDVRNYKKENEAFPHESTVDQFFNESQFESYRALGRHIVGQMCGDALHSPPHIVPSVAAFMGWSKNYIDRVAETQPKKRVKALVDWVEKSLYA